MPSRAWVEHYVWFTLRPKTTRHALIGVIIFLLIAGVFLKVTSQNPFSAIQVTASTALSYGYWALGVLALLYTGRWANRNWLRLKLLADIQVQENPELKRKLRTAQPDPSLTAPIVGYELDTLLGGETVHRSPLVDRYLRNKDYRCELSSREVSKIHQTLRSHGESFEKALRIRRRVAAASDDQFINQRKLCLFSDLEPKDAILRLGISDYYTSWLTNEFCTRRLVKSDKFTSTLFDGADFYPWSETRGTLRTIADSGMANGIGVSTLAYTADQRFYLLNQRGSAVVPKGRMAPSGSGSCDARDYFPGEPLRAILIRGMQRELREETSLRRPASSEVMVTEILGHFRWVQRGGKPEFVGVSRLRVNAEDLTPDGFEVDLPLRREEGTVDYAPKVTSIEELHALEATLYGFDRSSVSLLMCITALREAFDEDPRRWSRFLGWSH